jgi:hypothetical protein
MSGLQPTLRPGPSGPLSVEQQSWVELQHSLPQQLVPALHVPASAEHGCGLHVNSQNGVAPEQTTPQAPQLKGSLRVSTHFPLQQPGQQMAPQRIVPLKHVRTPLSGTVVEPASDVQPPEASSPESCPPSEDAGAPREPIVWPPQAESPTNASAKASARVMLAQASGRFHGGLC